MKENVLLKNLTTIKTGGPARYFSECSSTQDLKQALSFAKAKNLKVLVIGGGSNLLIADQGFDGVVIHLTSRKFSIDENGSVIADAGVNWDNLVEACCHKRLSGIEALSGIPGLVGATPIQNVGAYGQEVSRVITKVEVLDQATLETRTFEGSDCQFAYRQSRFKGVDLGKWIITAVTFQLYTSENPEPKYAELKTAVESDGRWMKAPRAEKILLIREHVLKIRSKKGMILDASDPDTTSVGSFFMNPIVSSEVKDRIQALAKTCNSPHSFAAHPSADGQWKLSAAWLIENAGIKRGQTHGSARVSTKHVLALTNPGGASTNEILALADLIVSQVDKKFGLRLEREPVLVL